MSELRQPLDFERLSEFRTLVSALSQRANPKFATPKLNEAVATFIWSRLWVELGLFAQSNNRPGYLTPADLANFERTIDGLFGEDCPPSELLKSARILEPVEGTSDLFCPWFARLNKHLAGDYKSKEEKGNVASAIVRGQKQLTIDAIAQGTFLPPEIYKKRDGTPMIETEKNRSLVLIRNLDNSLSAPARKPMQFTEGLIADAHAVIAVYSAEDLKKFYIWLALHKDRPNIPKTAEQILREFETFYGVSLA